jgi:hypothetical protein
MRCSQTVGADFRTPARSDLQVVSTGAQKIAIRRPPERFLNCLLKLRVRQPRRTYPGRFLVPARPLVHAQE